MEALLKPKISRNNLILSEIKTKIIKDFSVSLRNVNLMFTLFFMNWFQVLGASDHSILTDLFDTEAFRGSWRWFDKVNWLGGILNAIISFVCFISLFTIALQIITTLGFFSNRTFWENVHEVKKANASSSLFGKKIPFGLGGYISETFQPTKTSGIDALFNIFFAFLPDIQSISDMNDDRDKNGLTEEDTVITWFVKTFPKKCLIILLLSAGFNGSLLKCYGMVVDGGGAALDRVANYQLASKVNNLLDSGSNFDFSLASDGSAKGKMLEGVAKKAYTSIVSSTSVTDAAVKQQIGAKCQNTIKESINDDVVRRALIANGQVDSYTLTDADWEYIHYNMIVNSDGNSTGDGDIVIDLSTITSGNMNGTWASNQYLHIAPILKKKAPSYNYLQG